MLSAWPGRRRRCSSATTNCAPRWNIASGPMRARRSPFLKSKRLRHFVCSRSIRPMSCCWKSASAAGSTATNVIDAPLATVIAPSQHGPHRISRRYADRRSPAKRPASSSADVPVICAEQAPEAIAVIEQQARRMHAPLHSAGQEWHVNVERGRLVYQDDRGLMDLAAPRLFGRHQFDNAGLAIATLRAQSAFRIEPAAFEAGIVNAEWPARMQRLASGALVERGAARFRDLARRRPQRRGRPCRRGGARRSRGTCLAPAGGHCRHDGQQGRQRVSRQLRRADAPHHRGANTGSRQCDAAGSAGGRRARARHARGNRRQRRSGAALAGAAWLTKCRRAS